ncbi:unnamed protein product [Coffea canephora]|uniref:Disease resistance R13L4/SHOC-2-like LRR domain-containing protein n=1 Tax=Coffea canephora TaxID=49390 RepID=A0A068VD55_COFCA|nr:unnamed protein product [Coffea canephora]
MPMEKKNELNEKIGELNEKIGELNEKIGGGWRFSRCILRKPKEKKEDLNERIGALLREAGIIICKLALSRVKGGDNTDGKKLEDVAEEYMMDLIGRNLVMVSERSSMGGVKASCIHDLLLEFCKSKAKETGFLRVLRGYDEIYTFNEPRYPPRLSICSSAEDFHKSKLFCPQLGSLLFFRQNAGDDFPLADVSFLFCIYKHLTVLNLEHIVLIHKELPTEVESLCRLRYLALRADAMRFVPLSISNLSSMETFYLQSLVEVSLPYTIWDMKKLRHVRVGGRLGARVLPSDNVLENSSTLPDLDTLCYLRLPFNQEGEAMLRRIPNIRRLKIVAADVGEEACFNMSQLDTLESLNILSNHFQGPRNHFELSFPKNLKKLLLSGLNLPWSKISLIEQLPNLEVLKLLCDSLRGRRWELTEGGFPKLRVLTLSDVNVVEWTETDTDSDDYFPCLEELKLVGELKLEQVPSCLERISTLEMIKVYIWGKGDYVGSVISLPGKDSEGHQLVQYEQGYHVVIGKLGKNGWKECDCSQRQLEGA